MRIVLAENDDQAVSRLKRLLGRIGFGQLVAVARDGRDAVRLVDKLRPDLLLLDCALPRMDGFEVVKTIRHQPAVVFTTAHTELRRQARETGAVDFLCKPLEEDLLRRAMEKVGAAAAL